MSNVRQKQLDLARKLAPVRPPSAAPAAAEAFMREMQDRLFSASVVADLPELSPRQRMAAESKADELLYGGAAGGGKTFLLAWVARTQARSGIILRRTYQELEDSIVQECLRLYGDPSKYNSSSHVWKFPDLRLRLGYAERIADVFQYQSAEFDVVGVDEVTQWSDSRMWEYMLSRLRSTRKGQRCRAIACTNPGNVGGSWVIHRWRPWLDPSYPNPATEGELRWFRRDEKGEDVECEAGHPESLSRTYIHARLEDNPHLGPEYRRQLMALPEPWRSQLLNGDWSIGLEDDPWQIVPTAWYDRAVERWKAHGEPSGMLDALGVDVARGGRDQTVLARRYDRTVATLQAVPGKMTPDGASVAALVVNAVGAHKPAIGLDVIGVGSSPYDTLRGMGYDVTPINGSESAKRPDGEPVTDRSGRLRMKNVRAAVYWNLRELLEANEIDLPPDPMLRAGLIAARWKPTPSGVQVREKDEIAASIGRSPDEADAVAYACYVHATPYSSPSEMLYG